MSRVRLLCRYGLVSAICLILHNFIMIATDAWHHALLLAVTESFCVVVVVGYLLHSRFTFETLPSWQLFFRYAVAMAMSLPVSIITIWLFAGLLGWRMTLAAPAATLTTILFNFAASRWALYRGRLIGQEGLAC